MTMTKQQIEQLQQELAWALKEADEAARMLSIMASVYQEGVAKVIEQYGKDNPKKLEDWQTAQAESVKATKRAKELRQKATGELEDYFPIEGSDPKPATGFSMRMEKAPLYAYPEDVMVKKLAHRGQTFLLKLDEKAIKQFVTANAVKDTDGNTWEMPDYLARWLPELQVQTVRKALISDKALIKAAPENEPASNEQ